MPTQSELRLSYAPVVQHVAPAVVNVYAAKVVQNRNPLLDDPIFRRFFGVPGGPSNQVQRSLGSGVIVDAGGLIVTNNHVIEGADEVKVSLADKREFEATLVLKDARTDLAILRVKDGHAAGDDVGEATDGDQPGHQRDDVELDTFRARHKPDHRCHQKAGCDRAKNHLPPTKGKQVAADL